MRADSRACRFGPDSAYADLAAEVFRLLADPTRIRIILALRDNAELPVNRLAQIVDKTPTATSQHLAKLRWGRIVGVRQDGNRMYYRLLDERARQLVALAVYEAEEAIDGTTAHERAGVAGDIGVPPACPHRPAASAGPGGAGAGEGGADGPGTAAGSARRGATGSGSQSRPASASSEAG